MEWHWQQSVFGGGGYITGLALDPFDPRRLYARCDVAGAFVSTDGGVRWEPRNAGLAEVHTHMVAALVPSPDQPGLVLRCSGDARGGRTYGSIHRSTDHGRSWTEVSRDVDFYGNGPTRMFGEICSFDPHQPGRVLVGGYRAGVWSSDDAGLSWQRVALHGERIATIRHHPQVPGLVYLGTVGDSCLDGLWALRDAPIADLVLEHGDMPRGDDGSLYRSRDGGRSWELMHRRPGWSVTGIDAIPGRPGGLVLSAGDGVHWSHDGGATLTEAQGLEAGKSHSFVRADPHRPGRFLTAPHDGARDVPLYESTDEGIGWHVLREHHGREHLHRYPSYIDHPRSIGGGISDVVFQPDFPDRFYMTGYFGVSRSDDGGENFTGEGFQGTETLCVESVVSDRVGGRVYATLCDHTSAVSDDGGLTYRPFAASPAPTSALAVSPHDPDLVLWGSGSKRPFHRDAFILRTTDGGRSHTIVRTFAGRRFVQALAADPHRPGRFFAFVDGDVAAEDDSAGLYRSIDAGESWQRIPSPFPGTLHRLPVEEDWIESELLPCVVYQKRNANGTNQLMACDPHRPGLLYVGEWTTGLYRSEDAGESWVRADAGLPFARSRLSVLSHVLADPLHDGRLYAGFVREGLWRSDDRGESWTRILGEDATRNATSVAVADDRIVVVSEPMWWTGTPSHVWCSEDGGHSWQDIHPAEQGAVRWKGVVLDAEGRIHAGSGGNGIFTARLAGGQGRAGAAGSDTMVPVRRASSAANTTR
ncbi:WD40/YVTN/BNR-like repeat-containing protein [Streptomyces sp. NBC_01618]|uniref:WD40/YVTN/BNR-like repeat-containing protein n=1 Tax=Streptomyces sp. NBC_01618 TaxID=2975900 RepID=UPI0038641EC8|nr:hypothetical protein OH735_37360 [Streptomyces sp. NBC_01618]